nr:protein kinase [Lolliginicoccus lacisalsi]
MHNGSIIADRFRLQRFIASGGMGEDWEARDTRLDRRVGVKILKPELSSSDEFLSRFRTEARTTAQLHHPSIASIFDYGESTDDATGAPLAYLVMEFVNGEPLNKVLSRMGSIPLPLALDMLEQTGRALQVAHDAGLVHRDVKPGNILITPDGQVKITDFGIAKAVDAAPITRTGHVMGTAQYISPEQASGQPATAASDVYSLGIVGYEALTGTRPFTGEGALTVAMKHIHETPPPLPTDIPPEARTVIEAALSKDPRARYQDGGSFAKAIAAARAGNAPDDPRRAITGDLPVAAAAAHRQVDATRIMAAPRTGRHGVAGSATGAAAHQPAYYQQPRDDGMSNSQKALAWGAAAMFVLVGITAAIMMISDMLDSRVPPPAPVPPTLVEPEPTAPVTTEPPATEETTEPPATTEETTTEPETSEPSETTEPPDTDTDTAPSEPTGDPAP